MSLTVAGVVSVLGSNIGKVVDGAITVIKIVASVSVALIFANAITTLLSLIVDFVGASLIGEFLGIVSMCLPFNANMVFGSILSVIIAIGTFVVAKKIYELTTNLITVSQ